MLFNNMPFPDYVFREFPKMITKDGKSVIVNSAEEEAELEEADEKGALIAQLDAKTIKYDKRWGVDRLRAALE